MRSERLSRAVVTFTLLVLLAGCARESRVVQANATAPVPVYVVRAANVSWPTGTDAVGSVRARVSSTLSSKVTGFVREVRVHAGDRIAAGQLVAVLDAQDLDVSYRRARAANDESRDSQVEADNAAAAAKANLELTQITFRRIQDLFEKRSVSNQEYDEAAARVKTAQANFEMAASKRIQVGSRIRQSEEAVHAAEVMRGYAEIRAPFSGTVTERRTEPGILATPGLPLLTIEQTGGYRLEVMADESLAPQVHLGQPVEVSIESLAKSLTSRVSEIVPSVSTASRAFVVKIDLPAIVDLRSGQFGKARFLSGARTAVTVPDGTVRRNGQIESVIVDENGTARMRLITTGEVQGDNVEVLTGLRGGELVIRDANTADGARVEAK